MSRLRCFAWSGATLVRARRPVFSKRALLPPSRPGHGEAERDPVGWGGRAVGAAVGRGRDADEPAERGRERAHAGEADLETHLRDLEVGGPEQVPRALDPAR